MVYPTSIPNKPVRATRIAQFATYGKMVNVEQKANAFMEEMAFAKTNARLIDVKYDSAFYPGNELPYLSVLIVYEEDVV